jgi:hypothetical protein
MKNEINSCPLVELTVDEMRDLNGGDILKTLFRVTGYIIGAIARIQERNGDTGAWLA